MTSSISVKTKAGAPGPVDRFYLDVSSWSLIWDLGRCNSRICSFELKVPINETHNEIVSVDDKETFSLRSRDLACKFTEMTFWIRAKGHDEGGHTLYGPWKSVVKDAPDCPPGSVINVNILRPKVETLLVAPIYYRLFSNPEATELGQDLVELNELDANRVNTENSKRGRDSEHGDNEKIKSFPGFRTKVLGKDKFHLNHRNTVAKFGKSMFSSDNNVSAEISVNTSSVPTTNGSVLNNVGTTGQPINTDSKINVAFPIVLPDTKTGVKDFRPSQPLVYHLGPFQFNGDVNGPMWVPLLAPSRPIIECKLAGHVHKPSGLPSGQKKGFLNRTLSTYGRTNRLVELADPMNKKLTSRPFPENPLFADKIKYHVDQDMAQWNPLLNIGLNSKKRSVTKDSGPLDPSTFLPEGQSRVSQSREPLQLILKRGQKTANLILSNDFDFTLRRQTDGQLTFILRENGRVIAVSRDSGTSSLNSHPNGGGEVDKVVSTFLDQVWTIAI